MIASSCSKHNEVEHHAAVLELESFSKTAEHLDFHTKGNAQKHIVKRTAKRGSKRMVLGMFWDHLRGWFGHAFEGSSQGHLRGSQRDHLRGWFGCAFEGSSQGPPAERPAIRKRPQNFNSFEKIVVGK